MKYLHYSSAPLTEVRSVAQTGKSRFKPDGLWFSVGDSDDGWKQWCEDNDFAKDRFVVTTEVVFTKQAQILRLSTSEAIDAFTVDYQLAAPWINLKGYEIDWHKVSKRYQAIIVAPYIWPQRLSMDNGWYYAWDCASGCVWDADAIAELKELVSS